MESLFLIEFLVDNVHFSNSTLRFDEATIKELGRTLVKFDFESYPSLEITEDDFKPSPNKDPADVTFKNGKSCLFSLHCATKAMTEGICINVTVMRAKGSSNVFIGKTNIPLGGSFADILTFKKPVDKAPVSKTTKDTYYLTDDKGNRVGSISVFVRLSCFGKMIVTQFQVGGSENKSFLFKGASMPSGIIHGGPSTFEMEQQIQNIPLDESAFPAPIPGTYPPQQASSYAPPCQGQHWGQPSGFQGPHMGGAPQQMQDQLVPPTPYNIPYYGPSMIEGQWGDMTGAMAPQYGMNDCIKAQGEDNRFKNFSAEVNGYSLNIKILKRKKKKSQACGRIMPIAQGREEKAATQEH